MTKRLSPECLQRVHMTDADLDALCDRMWERGLRPTRNGLTACGGHGSSDRIKEAVARWRDRNGIGEIEIREEPDPPTDEQEAVKARIAAMAAQKQREAEVRRELRRAAQPYTIPECQVRARRK